MSNVNEEKKSRLRFVLLYAFSLVLIFIVVTAFWKKSSDVAGGSAAEPGSDDYFMQYDTLLYNSWKQIDEESIGYLRNVQKGNSTAVGFVSAKKSFESKLDSLEKEASFLTTGAKKQAIEQIVARYRKSIVTRSRFMEKIGHLPKGSTPVIDTSSGSNAETNNLRSMLAGKDQRILDLENQLRQKNAALQSGNPSAIDNSGEWKQKYNSLRSEHDKLLQTEKSLRSAYKTVADDNRRLLAELQQTKKG